MRKRHYRSMEVMVRLDPLHDYITIPRDGVQDSLYH